VFGFEILRLEISVEAAGELRAAGVFPDSVRDRSYTPAAVPGPRALRRRCQLVVPGEIIDTWTSGRKLAAVSSRTRLAEFCAKSHHASRCKNPSGIGKTGDGEARRECPSCSVFARGTILDSKIRGGISPAGSRAGFFFEGIEAPFFPPPGPSWSFHPTLWTRPHQAAAWRRLARDRPTYSTRWRTACPSSQLSPFSLHGAAAWASGVWIAHNGERPAGRYIHAVCKPRSDRAPMFIPDAPLRFGA